LRIGTADEDAAVGIGINPELSPDLKVCVGVLRDQMPIALVGLNVAILQPPIGFAAGVPVIQVGTVKQGDSAGVGLTGRLLYAAGNGESKHKQPHRDDRQAAHCDLLRVHAD